MLWKPNKRAGVFRHRSECARDAPSVPSRRSPSSLENLHHGKVQLHQNGALWGVARWGAASAGSCGGKLRGKNCRDIPVPGGQGPLQALEAATWRSWGGLGAGEGLGLGSQAETSGPGRRVAALAQLSLSAQPRLQGAGEALHMHLEVSEARSSPGTMSTERAPGPPQKYRLEITFTAEKEKLPFQGAARVAASEVSGRLSSMEKAAFLVFSL